MICLKCGQENPDNAVNCFLCNIPLPNTPEAVSNQPVTVKVSRLALVAIILAFCGLILITPSFIASRSPKMQRNIIPDEILVVSSLLGLFSLGGAIALGFVSFINIEISGGKATGRNFAVGAILIPIFTFILLLWSMLFPRVRSTAFRMVCGTNLSGLGKAMLIYANDYDDEMPRAGGKSTTWGQSVNYNAMVRQQAYGMKSDGSGGSATISASLYLLVKYAEVQPKSFICKSQSRDGSGDKGVSEFKPSRNVDLISLWDFGPEPWKYNSYSYHMPYSSYPLTTSSDPGVAVAADRNPWIPSTGWNIKNFSVFDPNGGKSVTKIGNTPTHQDEGQNVLFLDSHVDFEDMSFCGINEDNIYTSWNGTDIRKGTPPKVGSQPADKTDSLLVNDSPPKKP